MPGQDDLEVLKAVLVVAAADGQILGSEKGVFRNLARRIGVDDATMDTLIHRAQADPRMKDELFQGKVRDAHKAMQLLVATARIDGDISEEERHLLVDISSKLGIGVAEFGRLYQAGIATADAVRGKSPFG